MTHAVAIVPAYNRADTVGATVTALRTVPDVLDVIVVDDGSSDRTAAAAAAAGARVVELARNRGKGAAVAAGVEASGAPEVYLLIDADLGETAALAGELLAPVAGGEADMCVAVLADPDVLAASADGSVAGAAGADAAARSSAMGRRGGFGLVKRFAARVLRAQTGQTFAAPLSGQRAVRGPLLRSLHLAPGFGLEIGLTLDAAARGASISEVTVGFTHRQTGRDLGGFAHRARIGRHVYRATVSRIGGLKANWHLAASLLSRVRVPKRLPSRLAHRPAREMPRRWRLLRLPKPPVGVRSGGRVRERRRWGSSRKLGSRQRSASFRQLRSRLLSRQRRASREP